MQRVDALLDLVREAKVLSMIDLTKGYWQIPLAPEAQEKPAFSASSGLYHFLKMPAWGHHFLPEGDG